MPGDSDEELRRVSSGWGRRPPKPPADPYTIERDPRGTGAKRGGEGGDEERPGDQDETERAREKDEELRRAGGAGAVSGPATSREPSGMDPGEAPEPREG